MDTKTYLNQIAVLNSVIRNKTEELQQLKGMTVSISTTQKEVNVQVTPDKDKLGSAVAEIVDLENDISEMISQALERRRQITTEISNLQNKNQYDVLYKRYVLRKANTGQDAIFLFIAQEKKEPYAIKILQADEFMVKEGKQLFHDLMDIYHECKVTDNWYGYMGESGDIQNLGLPKWLQKEFE